VRIVFGNIMFVKICPECKSSNINLVVPQAGNVWICMACGNRNFQPIEVMDKDLKKLK